MSMITELELAQRTDLLIANGQQTADLLRHLANNHIDSDYFAVTSECEAYGTEIDAELTITDFALRAAGYVDALVEALEARDKQIDILRQDKDTVIDMGLERINKILSRAEAAEKRIAELEAKLAVPVKLPKTNGYWTEQEKAFEEGITLAKRQIRLAGFRCEGDE